MDLILGYYFYEKFTQNENFTSKKNVSEVKLITTLLKLAYILFSAITINYLIGSQWTLHTLHNYSFIAKLLYSLIPTFLTIPYSIYWFFVKKYEYNQLVMKCVELLKN